MLILLLFRSDEHFRGIFSIQQYYSYHEVHRNSSVALGNRARFAIIPFLEVWFEHFESVTSNMLCFFAEVKPAL